DDHRRGERPRRQRCAVRRDRALRAGGAHAAEPHGRRAHRAARPRGRRAHPRPLGNRMSAGSRKVLLVAGEASGDNLGAGLVTALRRSAPDIEIWGVGGARLREAGMHILVDTAAVATMGLVETFGTLGRLVSTYRLLKRFMVDERPGLLVLIDYPEFNLFL